MPTASSVTTLTLTPMTKREAAALLKRMLGSYPSLNLHDPETSMATITSLFASYPLWAAESAAAAAVMESKFAPPSLGVLKPLLEDRVRTHRYAADWERNARQQLADLSLLQIEGPKKLTYDELKAKYGDGKSWGLGDKAREPSLAQYRENLLFEIGQERFDAIPDRELGTWKKAGAAT